MKKLILSIHRWLGLGTGLVVFIVAVTGALFAFSDEVKDYLRRDYRWLAAEEQAPLPLDSLLHKVQSRYEMRFYQVVVYNHPRRSVELQVYKQAEDAGTAFWYLDTVEAYYTLYVHPATGQVLKVINEKYDFFHLVKMMHWSLLLHNDIGQPIVGYSTLLFVLLLLTGLWLWYPKSNKGWKQRFWFYWTKTTGRKRKNYDLHNIGGFYAFIPALVLALTGMVWAFPWFRMLVYVLVSMSTTPPDLAPPPFGDTLRQEKISYQKALDTARRLYPAAAAYGIALTQEYKPLAVTVQQTEHRYAVLHQLYVHPSTGEVLKHRTHAQKNAGEKLITANYDIHVGAIAGFAGKLLAFVVSLLVAMLPVTGFYIWWGRRNKKKRKGKGRTKTYRTGVLKEKT